MNATDAPLATPAATHAPLAPRATPAEVQTGQQATADHRNEVGGARLLVSDAGRALSDVRLAFLVADEAYERVVAQAFGIPREQQTFLVKLILTGALATVLEDLAPRPPRILRPSGSDTAIGLAVLGAAVDGLAGAPSRTIPAAGALIGFAVLAHSLRSALARSSRDVHALGQRTEARYRHRSTRSIAADRGAWRRALPPLARIGSAGLQRPRRRHALAGAVAHPQAS